MSTLSSTLDRRSFIASSAAVGAYSLLPAAARAAVGDNAIRPFRVNVPEAELVDLRRRIAATRWPDKETVADRSQGTQLAKLQELVRYWGTDYDWRKVEAQAQCPASIHDNDRWRGHSLHPRSFET